MDFNSYKTIGLLGYIIVVNEEIHSRQIQMLNDVLIKYEIVDDDDIIKNILDDKEDKVTYNDCITAFQREDKEVKHIIYRICFQLAIIDSDSATSNKPDSKEESVLRNLESYMDTSNISLIRNQSIKELNKFIYFSNSDDKNTFNLDFSSLLSVASDDYDIYGSVFNKIFSECNILSSRLQTKLNVIKMSLLKTTLESFLSEYKEKVLLALSELKDSSSKKELAAQNFSIALMGRTKAGKSTLHYIMCNEGQEFIGKGSQRTTRFNRVFSWNKLKIIDTPGIGAGEEEGKKDEAIALSVLSQADMICFVVIDDTIQNDVLDLLNQIAEYHKPMLIVLNHKEDIRKKSHLKTFMNNPCDWRLTKGESNLAGYINRLTRNAVVHNYDKLMKIVPVFLLAAQIGKEQNDDLIFQASNYQAFIDAIHSLIRDNSIIYKSQTMLDEPSIRLHKAFTILEDEKTKLCTLRDKVKRIRRTIFDSIASSRRTILFESERSIKTEFDDFFTAKSYDYVEENYEEKSIFALNKSYNQYLEDYKVKEHISDILSEYITEYHDKISEIVSEIDEELNYAKLNTANLFGTDSASIKGNRTTFSFKGLFKAASMILDVLSIAWPVLAVISIPISLFGGFFKSKQQKINDAKALTLDNFSKLSDYSKEQVLKKSKETLEQLLKEDEEEIKGFFNALEEQLDEIISFVSSCSAEFDNGIKAIDMNLAKRIIQYITNKQNSYDIVKTERDLVKNTFIIYVRNTNVGNKIDVLKYQNISTEKIKIRYVN